MLGSYTEKEEENEETPSLEESLISVQNMSTSHSGPPSNPTDF